MSVQDFLAARAPTGRWGRRARLAIAEVVKASGPGIQPAALLAAVDAAYPFGHRGGWPYTAWLTQRRLFRAALTGGDSAHPTRDDIDACEVARDMEMEGRIDDARRALDLAPNRLGLPCLACGAKSGEPCLDMTLPIEFVGTDATELLVPHHARLVGHLDAGPLFEAR